MNTDNYLTSKELAQRAGISLKTLRNYRKRGRIRPSAYDTARNGGIKYLWAPHMLARVQQIREENQAYVFSTYASGT